MIALCEAKMLSSILCTALFQTITNALAYDLPRQTSVWERYPQSSGPIPETTVVPRQPPALRQRQDDLTTAYIGPDQTCGFISGLAGEGHTCDEDDYCVLYPATGSNFGSVACVDDYIGDTTIVTTCVDSSDFYSQSAVCDNGCRLDTNTLKCTDFDFPYCNSIYFEDGQIVDYTCDSLSISSWQLAATTFNGENTLDDGRSWSTTLYNEAEDLAGASTTGSDFEYTSLTVAFSSSYETQSSVLGAGSVVPSNTSIPMNSVPSSTPSATLGSLASSSTSALPPNKQNQNSATPVGAIVGGTIGSLALVALVAAGAFILKRKYQRSEKSSSTTHQPSSKSPSPSSLKPTGPSEMEATSSTPVLHHEFYKPVSAQQAPNPSGHQYEAVPSSEIPIIHEPRQPSETFLSANQTLERSASTAGVSLLTANESVAISPTANFGRAAATVIEAPGNYEYLDPPMSSDIREHARDSLESFSGIRSKHS